MRCFVTKVRKNRQAGGGGGGGRGVPFRVLSRTGTESELLDWYLLGVKNPFEPRPSNEIRVPLRVFFDNFRQAPPSF